MFVSSFFGCKKTDFFAKNLPNDIAKRDIDIVFCNKTTPFLQLYCYFRQSIKQCLSIIYLFSKVIFG